MKSNRFISTATVLTLCIVLFYLPSIIFQIEKGEGAWEFDTVGIVMATFYTTAFCLNYFWLVPSIVHKKNKLSFYFIINILLVLITMSFAPFWLELHGGIPDAYWHRQENISIWRYIVGYAAFSIRDGIMVILAGGLAYAIKISWEKEYIRTRELELNSERQQIELRSLKAQLNPHFLFNTLNNIYALIAIAPEKAQDSLHTFSSMLRFMIYESSESVDLEKEKQFIKEYVELMKLRIGDSCKIKYNMMEMPAGLKITPLIYLTLVENAFKHSGSNGRDYYIRFSWELEETKKGKEFRKVLWFTVENTFNESKEESKRADEPTGVGLKNVQQQLKLLYPGAAVFSAEGREGVFIAKIGIETRTLEIV